MKDRKKEKSLKLILKKEKIAELKHEKLNQIKGGSQLTAQTRCCIM